MSEDWRGDGDDDGANRFDESVKHHHQHGADGFRPPDRPQRIEVITGQRRRSWSKEEKAAITAESLSPGANVAEVARRHGLSVGLLHYWRRRARDQGSDEAMRFIPIVPESEMPATKPPGPTSLIQIDYAGARIRVNGAVDSKTLAAVLAALQAQS